MREFRLVMRRASAWILPLALPAAVACGREGGDQARVDSTPAPAAASAAPTLDTVPSPAQLARARAAADAMGKELQAALFAAMERGGPTEAVSFCADSAQAISARHAAEGVIVRRVSLRVRNPRNAPDAAERTWLLRLDSLQRAGTLPPEESRMVDGRVEYVRPILVADRCLTCHGDPATIAAPVRWLLQKRYPADSATGYRAGDLRGAISVRLGG